MTRRRGQQALQEAERAKDARWRYAVRNPTFRSELRELSELFQVDSKEARKKYRAFLLKWRFQDISETVVRGFTRPDLTTDEERLLYLDSSRWGILSRPVVAMSDPSEDMPWVGFIVDTSHPRDVLLADFGASLDRFMPKRRVRRRSDKTEFYLAVYDRALDGQTFAKIAAALRRSISTVKSAYLTARRHIFGRAGGLSKTRAPLAGFEQDHIETCLICRKAQKVEDMCPAARTYVSEA